MTQMDVTYNLDKQKLYTQKNRIGNSRSAYVNYFKSIKICPCKIRPCPSTHGNGDDVN